MSTELGHPKAQTMPPVTPGSRIRTLGTQVKKRNSSAGWADPTPTNRDYSIENGKARSAADLLAGFLDVVASNATVEDGSMSKHSEGFCYIAKNSKTRKFHGHAGMNIGDNRISVTFQQQTINGCELFVHSWANHAIANLRYKSK